MSTRSWQPLIERACMTFSDIYRHLPTLYRYASCCRHVAEFGTRTGLSTLALLRAIPERLVAYDWVRLPEVDRLEELARLQNVDFSFRQLDTRLADLEPTDLLFIDTHHTRGQLDAELSGGRGKRAALPYYSRHRNLRRSRRGRRGGPVAGDRHIRPPSSKLVPARPPGNEQWIDRAVATRVTQVIRRKAWRS